MTFNYSNLALCMAELLPYRAVPDWMDFVYHKGRVQSVPIVIPAQRQAAYFSRVHDGAAWK